MQVLALYHTIPSYKIMKKEVFENIVGKGNKMFGTIIFSFSHNIISPITYIKPVLSHVHFCRLQMLSIWNNLKIVLLDKELNLQVPKKPSRPFLSRNITFYGQFQDCFGLWVSYRYRAQIKAQPAKIWPERQLEVMKDA